MEVLQELEAVGVEEGERATRTELQLAKDSGILFRHAAGEMFFLLHSISLKDRYFADHKAECEHEYSYCINTAFYLLKDTAVPSEGVSLCLCVCVCACYVNA